MAKKSTKKKSTASDSWKGIKQGGRKAVTSHAKRKRFSSILKISSLTLAAIFVIACVVAGAYLFKNRASSAPLKQLAHPVENIDFQTDGVLTEKYVLDALSIPKNVGMLDLDIFELKQQIENIDQVNTAIVEREFPSTLKISVIEHKPILKVVVSSGKDKREGLLISETGHVYKGACYKREAVKDLLYIQGVELHKTSEGFRPLKNIEAVAQLVSIAKTCTPELYKHWKRVSFEYISNGPTSLGAFIKIGTQSMGDIIFAPHDFEVQLERLATIMNYIGENNVNSLERIDLSLDGQAAVQIAQVSRTNRKA